MRSSLFSALENQKKFQIIEHPAQKGDFEIFLYVRLSMVTSGCLEEFYTSYFNNNLYKAVLFIL